MKHTIILVTSLLIAPNVFAQRGQWQDFDGDGHPDEYHPLFEVPADNCPRIFNSFQLDGDGDGIGAACDDNDHLRDARDGDQDGDGHTDGNDQHCPQFASQEQVPVNYTPDGDYETPCRPYVSPRDTDPDGDADNDGVPNLSDSNPLCYNPTQAFCINTIAGVHGDKDGDGVPDSVDNCPDTKNYYQEGICNGDYDNDGIPDVRDLRPYDDPAIARQVPLLESNRELTQQLRLMNRKMTVVKRHITALNRQRSTRRLRVLLNYLRR